MLSNKKRLALISVLVLAVFTWVACSPAANNPAAAPETVVEQPIELVDGLGRRVVLDAPAQRVVSLAPSNTEILFAIGAGAQVVGRDDFSDYPNQAQDLPSIGGSFGDYNLEAIVDLDPDLVLASELNTSEQVKALEDLGLKVYLLSNPEALDGMYENLHIVAQLTGHDQEAGEFVDSLKARVAAVDERLASVSERPLVFYEIDSTDPNAPYTAGAGTFINRLIERAKGENLGLAMDVPYGQISLEELVVQDPDIILLGDSVWGGVTVEDVQQRSGWQDLSAVSGERVYPFDDNLVSRPGPRLVDGLETLADLLHPQAGE
ncbi:MAG: cobalamin-binding protein [Anaerolineales bacterium]